jgi:enolase-phosphatase E1
VNWGNVALPLDQERVHWLLLDVEGTTTPVDFVGRILLPYARERVEGFLRAHHEDADVQEEIQRLLAEHGLDVKRGSKPPDWVDSSPESSLQSAWRYFYWLMDQDRKSTALKSLQGRIWEEGYRSGELQGDVYADVPSAFSRWQKQKKKIGIFSSGSILAQKLLFKTTPAGNLTSFLSAHFDTTTGAKVEVKSYRRIAGALNTLSQRIVFISDATAELDAAAQCSTQTLLCVRPGRADPADTSHALIHSFDEVLP